MRIIAGSKKGMNLLSPKTDVSRPITDRVKESLFSILYNYHLPAEKTVADLFCGVGSLGLEALSRDAEFVTFVEKDSLVAAVLQKNIAKAGFVRESKVIKSDAFKVGAPISFDRPKYDLVFVDPPFKSAMDTGPGSQLDGLLNLLPQQTASGAIIVVRTHKSVQITEVCESLEIIDRRQWGVNAVTLLRRKKI